MKDVQLVQDPRVRPVFQAVPELPRQKLMALRELILETARETDGVNRLEETLKWGEPSYICPIGSTIRIHWKEKAPDQVAMYFSCSTRLVPTFRQVFQEDFQFEGKRAVVLPLNEEWPEAKLKQCIAAGLTYKKIKNEGLLGF